MMLQAARLPARTLDDGTLAVLAEQNRQLWDQLIGLGMRHFAASATGDTITTYHFQAEIAAVHATSPSESETDWQKLVELYDDLYKLEPTPIVLLNRAIAIALPWTACRSKRPRRDRRTQFATQLPPAAGSRR